MGLTLMKLNGSVEQYSNELFRRRSMLHRARHFAHVFIQLPGSCHSDAGVSK